jgi:ADP-heptose:LPS heptosyltransferase
MKKCLVIELWWIGDATLMTPILEGLQAADWEITVLGKLQSRLLLQDDYPRVRWIEFEAPWTAFRGKYKLWRWPWHDFLRVLREVRRGSFDASVSVRRDPRDQLLVWLAGIPRRVGIRAPLGFWFLNEPLPPPPADHHRVEDWWNAQQRICPEATTLLPPRLEADAATQEHFRTLFTGDPRPVVALHCGARNAVRRWPENHLRELILALQDEFDFQLALYPDTDGYGGGLADLASQVLTGLTLPELKASLRQARLLLANDSGPGHVAEALGVPVVTFFGPGDPRKMRPFSPRNLVVLRDICPYHPCSDYCHFPEPYCLTQLTPGAVLREVRQYLRLAQILPPRAGAAATVDATAPSTPSSGAASDTRLA